MVDNKIEYAKWLMFQIDHNGRYHNHKETMAWVITALYIPGIITIGYLSRGLWYPTGQVIISILLLILGYLVFVFMKMQFDMRWYAADVVAVLMRRLAKLNSGDEPPSGDEWEIDEEDKYRRPKFMKCDMDKEEKRAVIAAFWDIFLWRWGKVDDRWKTELPSYIALVLATLVALVLMWFLP